MKKLFLSILISISSMNCYGFVFDAMIYNESFVKKDVDTQNLGQGLGQGLENLYDNQSENIFFAMSTENENYATKNLKKNNDYKKFFDSLHEAIQNNFFQITLSSKPFTGKITIYFANSQDEIEFLKAKYKELKSWPGWLKYILLKSLGY